MWTAAVVRLNWESFELWGRIRFRRNRTTLGEQMDGVQSFDPGQDYSVVWRKLPHWTQAGTACFITWRTADSMPRHVVAQWIRERSELLKGAGVSIPDDDVRAPVPAMFQTFDLNASLEKLDPAIRWKLQCDMTDRFDSHLDACHGACVLKERKLAEIVSESLLKFDGSRYLVTDFVVMPNHVHLLAAFPNEETLLKQCRNWKRYTARAINAAIKGCGEFWQVEAFDHLVRSLEHFEHYRRYIAENGPKAGLLPSEYLHYSKG